MFNVKQMGAEQMTAQIRLVHYDAARRALSAARSVDEVKHVRGMAAQMRAYGQQAKDKQMLADAQELRDRAERKLGELMAEQSRTVGKANGAKGVGTSAGYKKTRTADAPATLAEAGIDKNLAHRARRAAALSSAAFEDHVKQARHAVVSAAARSLNQADKKERRAARELELAQKIKALPDKRYGVIYADPAWKFLTRSEAGMDRSADNHYTCQNLADILALPVADIAADDCVLFLWVPAPLLPSGLQTMAAWGFTFITCAVWVKPHPITGYWFRSQHEVLLVGTSKNVVAPAPGTQFSSVFHAAASRHSEKPEAFAKMIEAYYPNLPKIELNRRGPARPDWDAWGNEAECVPLLKGTTGRR
jgi:N6-adenosine-specific RNA methylase IME4